MPHNEFIVQLRGVAVLMVVLISAYLCLNVRQHPALDPSVIGLGAALMLYGAARRGEAGRRPSTLLGRTGFLGYEIYLFHAIVQLLLMQVLPRSSGVGSYVVFAVVMAVTYFISAGIAHVFSVPLNRWIRSRLLNDAPDAVADAGRWRDGAGLTVAVVRRHADIVAARLDVAAAGQAADWSPL
jgi:peptidoglycan/LPS O-acetylase OafA/YrhL